MKQLVVIWVDPDDCNPPHGLDMNSPHDADKVAMLAEEFKKNGFGLDYPALVGYPLNGRIQLLGGTHRHLAAKIARVKLPISLWLRSYIEALWGTEKWETVLADIPVKKLMEFEQQEIDRKLVEDAEPLIFEDMYPR